MGFSKFGHFKAPIKRPQCNPIVKDERFRKLVNEGNSYDAHGLVSCNPQALIKPKVHRASPCPLNLETQSNFMFAFS